jgi:hypothetical protein
MEMDFKSWLTNQGIDPDVLPDKERVRAAYDQAHLRAEALQTTTLGPGTTGGYGYAVAIEDGADLRVTLWVRRGPKICVVLQPRGREWDPHVTYHLDGQYHNKSYGIASGVQQRQRLDQFKGTEHLGVFMGHGPPLPKCNPSDYTDLIRVPAGVLTGLKGGVMLDLVEPGVAPNPLHRETHEVIQEKTYRDCSPWVVVAVVVPRAAKIEPQGSCGVMS